MTRIRVLLWVLIILGAVWAFPVSAESISDFDVTLDIHNDSSVTVTERITYDFGGEQRHGIFRTIPLKSTTESGTYHITLSNVSVQNEHDEERPYTTREQGDEYTIKIGDPDTTVTGQQTYVIRYTVELAIGFFAEHEELYWNVTGHEWTVPITRTHTQVLLPETVVPSDIIEACYAGVVGVDAGCPSASGKENGRAVSSFTANELAPGEGLTIVVGWPRGIVAEPSTTDVVLRRYSASPLLLLLPLVTGGFLFWRWQQYGRDPDGSSVIKARYSPPEQLSPAEAGTLVDEVVNKADITAEIIHLAVAGYLIIERVEKKHLFLRTSDWKLHKAADPDSSLSSAQRLLLEKLFPGTTQSVTLSSLRKTFHKDVKSVSKAIYTHLVQNGYFPDSPERVRNRHIVTAVVLFGIGAFILFALERVLLGISLDLTGAIILVFAFLMPVRTQKGVATREHILGLKKYLSVAEKDRLAFHNAPEKNPKHFDELLPYAVALGVEKQWAEAFKDLQREEPSWYHGSTGSFSSSTFASDMASFTSSARTAFSSGGGSSGFSGGSAGGGGGGGGGGSW